MAERTEEAALTGSLQVKVAGEVVELEALSWEASDAWRAKVIAAMSEFDVSPEGSLSELLEQWTRAPLIKMHQLLLAWDTADRLGHETLRSRITPVEVKAAFEVVADFADPFGELRRLAVEAFGSPAAIVRELMSPTITAALQQELSTLSPSGNGEQPSDGSTGSGPPSSSSSAGPTRRTASGRKLRPVETRSQTASTSATRKSA